MIYGIAIVVLVIFGSIGTLVISTHLAIESDSVIVFFISIAIGLLLIVSGADKLITIYNKETGTENTSSMTYTVYKVEYYDGPSGGFKKVWLEDEGEFFWVIIEPEDKIEIKEGKEVTFTPEEYEALVKSTTNK